MTTALLATIPLQLVCQLIVPGTPGSNDTNFATNRSPLPEGYVVPAGARVAHLFSLPLELVCQLLVTNNPGVTENGTLVESEGETITTSSTVTTPTTVTEAETTTETPNATLPDGYVSFLEDHAAYKIYYEKVTWEVARDRCISKGARLAIADSPDKIQRISGLRVGDADYWLSVGIYHSNTTNEWVRVDNGSPVTSVPWASVENNPTEGCAGISMSEDALVSYPCASWEDYFVCEISLSEG